MTVITALALPRFKILPVPEMSPKNVISKAGTLKSSVLSVSS